MKNTYFSFALAALSCMSASAQNLIVNGGFETATVPVPTGTPLPFYPNTLDGWGAVTTDGEFILGAAQAHTGNGFMSMLDNGGANPGTPWLGTSGGAGYDRGYQEVDVDPSTSYTLTYWYRAGDGSRYGYGAGSTSVQVEEVLPTNVSLINAQEPATNVWQQASVQFTTGSNTTRIIVMFSALGPTSTDTWYDDVVLQESKGEGIIEHGLSANWGFDHAGSLWVEPSSVSSDLRLEIINAAGLRVVAPMVVQAGRSTVDLSTLASGAYVAVLRNTTGYTTQKVIVAR